MRTLPGFLRSPAEASQAPADLADVLRPLCAAIATVSGASLVVDSSKLPTYAGVLRRRRPDPRCRAPRARPAQAAAFSEAHREQPDRGRPGLMEQRGREILRSLDRLECGLERNLAPLMQDYTRVRYETFAAHPAGTIRAARGFRRAHRRRPGRR